MVCSQCGAEMINAKLPCPECGHMMTEQEDMDNIIKDILEEDDYTPESEEVKSEILKKEESNNPKISQIFGSGSKPSKETKKTKGLTPKPTTKPATKPITKPATKPTTKPITKPTTKPTSKPSKQPPVSTVKKQGYKGKRKLGDTVVIILRYTLAAVIVLFSMSMFFNWFTLKENAVNYGMVRTEEVKAFMTSGLEDTTPEDLDVYLKTSDVPIATFSGMDLYKFGRNATEPYMTIKGPSGIDNTSMVSLIQKYYMQAMILPMIISIISLIIVLVFRSLKGIGIVRNLTVVNLMVIGLNYLALKVPYFSMFAIKGKDVLGTTLGLKPSEISMTMEGVVAKSFDAFYPYEFYQERGFMFAMVMLGLWLLLGIILTEVKHRKDEIAIENGEIK